MIITVGHTEGTLPTIIKGGHATNSTHQACTEPTRQEKNDGREPQRKPHDKSEGCWTTRGNTTPETIDSKQYMECKDATTTSATAAIDGIQHDAATHDETTDDATTDDADSKTATYDLFQPKMSCSLSFSGM